jgi:hypothetical protein
MEAELRGALDRIAIQNLIYRYSDAVTRADWKQCEAVLAPDAIWEAPLLGLRYESRDAFLETLRATTRFDLLIQTPHSPVVTLADADHASATTTIHEINRGVTQTESELGAQGSEVNIDTYGIYYDDIANRRTVGVHTSAVRAVLPHHGLGDGRRADRALKPAA